MSDYTYLKPWPARGIVGLIALTMIGIGAGVLWGPGGMFLTVGLVVFIDASSDEAVERITKTRRADPPSPFTSAQRQDGGK